MTYFGACVKVNEKVALRLPSENADSELLHISKIVLTAPAADNERFLVHVPDAEGKEYVIAILDNKNYNQAVDFYVTVNTTVRVSGPASPKQEVHITGYSEPIVMSDEEDDLEGTSEEEEPSLDVANLSKNFRETLSKATSEQTEDKSGDDSDDDDEEEDSDDDDEEEDSSEMGDASEEETTATHAAAEESSAEEEGDSEDEEGDDSESDSEEEESEVETVPVEAPAKKSKKPVAQPVTKSKKEEHKKEEHKKEESSHKKEESSHHKKDESKKRKLQNQPEGAPASKKASTPESAFEASIIAFLKSQGTSSCKISNIGAKVKKPAELKATKLGAFLRERSGVFTVNGDSVSLKK